MKNVKLMVALMAVGMLMFTSCSNKEFSCNCTATRADGSDAGSSTYPVEASSKEDAEGSCGTNGQAVYVDSGQITHRCNIN